MEGEVVMLVCRPAIEIKCDRIKDASKIPFQVGDSVKVLTTFSPKEVGTKSNTYVWRRGKVIFVSDRIVTVKYDRVRNSTEQWCESFCVADLASMVAA